MNGLDVGCGIYRSHPVIQDALRVDVQRTIGNSDVLDVVCDAYHLPFVSSVFGFVRMSHMPEHLDNPVAAFKEALRVLKSGGELRITVPHRLSRYNKTPPDKNRFQMHRCSFKPTWFDAVFRQFQRKITVTTGTAPFPLFFLVRPEEIQVTITKKKPR